MKVALVHYWLVNMRGGEKVLEALCELFPQADIYTHVYIPDRISPTIRRHLVKTTFIQHLPGAARHYQKYLPLMPLALEQLDLRGYDLVISSESGPAKGVIVDPGALHICYCHSPMRYVWDLYHEYMEGAGWLKRSAASIIAHYLRTWDAASAARVDQFVCNSRYVRRRVQKAYRRKAAVIPPPVDTELFTPCEAVGDFYLYVGQLVPYKRADIAVHAFNRLGKRLIIVGEGEEKKRLEKIAAPNVELLGHQPISVIQDLYSRCRALVFPGTEDFGIVPVEAMAAGRPVIAFRSGGALDSVLEGQTGLFFDEQTPESLAHSVVRFEETGEMFDSRAIALHAARFDRRIFKQRIKSLVQELLRRREASLGPSAVSVPVRDDISGRATESGQFFTSRAS